MRSLQPGRLLDDERGQSVQVGAAILLGFVVIAITMYQVQVVPDQNADVEFNHNQEVRQDMTELRNAINDVGAEDSSRSSSVQLGTQYPARSIFVNPSPPRGILQTESAGNISISNATVSGTPSEDYSTEGDTPQEILDGTHATSRISYMPRYTEFDGAPTTTIEHSLGFNSFDNNVSDPITPQGVVNGDAITLTVLRGNVSEQGSSTASIDPRTVTATEEIDIESDGGPITIDLPTETPSVWNETLGQTFDEGESDARVASWDPAAGTIRVELDRPSYTFQIAMVGVGNGVPQSDRYDVDRTDGSGGEGGGGAYDVDWTNPSNEIENSGAALTECSSDSCRWNVGSSADDTLTLNTSLKPRFEGISLEYAADNPSVGTLSYKNGTTAANGSHKNILTAQGNGTVDVLTSANDGSDTIQIEIVNHSDGGGGGGTTSGEQTAYIDGSGSAAREWEESRLDFDVQNNGATDVTITQISIDTPNSNNLTAIYEDSDGDGAGHHEVFFDSSTSGWLETGDSGSDYQLGTTATLTQPATLSSGEQVQVTALDFRNNDDESTSVADTEVSVTLTFQDGSSTTFNFTPPGY